MGKERLPLFMVSLNGAFQFEGFGSRARPQAKRMKPLRSLLDKVRNTRQNICTCTRQNIKGRTEGAAYSAVYLLHEWNKQVASTFTHHFMTFSPALVCGFTLQQVHIHSWIAAGLSKAAHLGMAWQ